MSEIFQTDDRYAGPILKERYQVLASAIGPTFYIYDHAKNDAVRSEGKDTKRFENIFEALSYLGFTLGEMESMSLLSTQDVENMKEIEMAKARVVTEAMAKAQASMEKRIAAKNAVKAASEPKAAKAEKSTKVAAPKAEKPATAVKSRGQAAMFREMIAANKMTDKEMLAAVRAAFPDKKVVESSVTFYRARM